MIEGAIPTLVLIGLAAVLAPIVAEWSRRFIAVPEVVIQIIFGILLGPYVLNLAHPNNIVTALSDFGLTYLMFLAGTELDLSTMRQGHLGRAAGSWGASLALALAVGVDPPRHGARARPHRRGALPDHDGARAHSSRSCTTPGCCAPRSGPPSCRWAPSGSSARSWRSRCCSRTVTPG